jgi:hypothetical protein
VDKLIVVVTLIILAAMLHDIKNAPCSAWSDGPCNSDIHSGR